MRRSCAVLALLFGAACERTPPPASDAANDTTAAVVMVVEGLDEEGGIIGRTLSSDTTRVAFLRDGRAFVDARALAEYLAPGARVDVVSGSLRLDGSDTGLRVELRDSAAYVPLQSLAGEFRAYARIEESAGLVVTVWRHDLLCRYAGRADRRAAVFLAAAEQGLLRHCDPPIYADVRRWADALPHERWAASVTLRQPLDSAGAAAFLEEYDAEPYAAYGVAAGHHVIVRAAPDSASLHVLGLLRAAAIEALERGLCGLPGALERRAGGRETRPGSQARVEDALHGERYMLAAALAARRELPRVRAGAPILFGIDAVAESGDLRRLAADARSGRFDAASRLDSVWVLPGADLSAAPGVTVPNDIAALDAEALFARLQAEAAQSAADCPDSER